MQVGIGDHAGRKLDIGHSAVRHGIDKLSGLYRESRHITIGSLGKHKKLSNVHRLADYMECI